MVHQGRQKTVEEKLLIIQKISSANTERVRRKFTGKTTLNWKDGEVKNEEIILKKEY